MHEDSYDSLCPVEVQHGVAMHRLVCKSGTHVVRCLEPDSQRTWHTVLPIPAVCGPSHQTTAVVNTVAANLVWIPE